MIMSMHRQQVEEAEAEADSVILAAQSILAEEEVL
jgi:hypothetical protein